jgi:hypothetical protein
MARPWESVSPRPWEAAQPIYDRTVSIRRLKTEAGAGATGNIGLGGYSGAEQPTTSPAGETILFTNVPASIQSKSLGQTLHPLVPGDVSQRPQWVIEIPSYAGLVRYAIRDRDIILDDEGYRYGVAQNRWTVFGYRLTCIRLET